MNTDLDPCGRCHHPRIDHQDMNVGHESLGRCWSMDAKDGCSCRSYVRSYPPPSTQPIAPLGGETWDGYGDVLHLGKGDQ